MRRVTGTIKVLLCIILSFVGVVQSHPVVRAAQTFSVVVIPNTAGDPAMYHLGGATCPLPDVDGLRLDFVGDTSHVDTASVAGLIRVNGVPARDAYYKDSGAGTSIELTLAAELSSGDLIDVVIDRRAGLVNPTWPRPCYTVHVALLRHGSEIGTIGSDQYAIVQSTISQLTVTSNPPITAIPSEYDISFVTGVNGSLKASADFVRVQFDGGVHVPETLVTSEVYINDVSCRGLVYRDPTAHETLIVYLPRDIARESQVNVRFSPAFGLRNPSTEGLVHVVVSTSVESQQVSSDGIQVKGPKVTDASVSMADPVVARPLAASFSFRTSLWGALAASDKIFVQLSSAYAAPSVSSPVVSLNGQAAVADVQGDTISVAAGAAIAAQSVVQLVFPASLGFTNPAEQGPQVFTVWTSRDSDKVTMTQLIEDSVVTGPKLGLSTVATSRYPAIEVAFNTSRSGALKAGVDWLEVSFGAGFVCPPQLSRESIQINGMSPQQYSFAGGLLTVVLPLDVPASGGVALSIAADHDGIRNAETPQATEVHIRTSRDRRSVAAGGVDLADVPTVTVTISPELPSSATIYTQAPSVSLAASDGGIVVYQLDDGPVATYGGTPVSIPEGSHTLSTYAIGGQPGLRSDPVCYTFIVDTKTPQITLDNSSMTFKSNGGLIEISGVASEPLSLLLFNGISVPIGADLHFSCNLPLRDGEKLVWTAIDIAGNPTSGSRDVHVDDTAPTLSIISPVEAARVTDQQQLEIRCRIDEDGTVKVDGVDARLDGGVWVATVELAEGSNTVRIQATDRAGNVTVQDLAVTRRTRSTCVLVLGSDKALLNGAEVAMGAIPVLSQGTVMVPLRFLSETIGATVEWNPAFKLITLRLGERSAQVQVGSTVTLIDGHVGPALQQAPFVVAGKTMVPLRFISETLGAEVTWEPATRTVIIDLVNR